MVSLYHTFPKDSTLSPPKKRRGTAGNIKIVLDARLGYTFSKDGKSMVFAIPRKFALQSCPSFDIMDKTIMKKEAFEWHCWTMIPKNFANSA